MAKLFGADGIRGRVDTPPLNPLGLDLLGRSLSYWTKGQQNQPVLLVGTDTRESCQRMKEGLVDSLNRAGVATVDTGVIPTAGISYLLASKGFFTGGMMISASHLPTDENGIKIFDSCGAKISDQVEHEIEEEFFSRKRRLVTLGRSRNVQEPDYARQYARDAAAEFRQFNWRSISCLIDCANGAFSDIARLICDGILLDPLIINDWPDGANINQDAGSEFARHYPGRMANELNRYDLQYGIALDGDGDRAVIVDADGHFYDGDEILAMLALILQQANRLNQNRVVTTPMSNSGLAEYLAHHTIEVEQVRNGDKYLTQTLVENNLTLGAEQIGHLVILTNPARLTGDGLRTALTVLAKLTENPGVHLRDLAPEFRKWPQINASINLDCRTNEPKDRIPGLVEKINEIVRHNPDIDIRACRPASTEPAYRIMIEARKTPVKELAEAAAELAVLIQDHFGCAGSPSYLDLVNGGLHPLPVR